MSTEKNNLVAYIRLSKETKRKNGTGLGLETQKLIINNYYSGRIVKWFSEVKSGKNMYQRPILNEAVEYCQQNGFTLVVAKVDRLGRNTDDILLILKQLKNKLICCDIPTEGYVDKFVLTLFSAIAERERDLISIRIKGTLRRLKAEGVKLGSPENNLTKEVREKAYQQKRENALNNLINQDAFHFIQLLKEKKKTSYSIAKYLNSKGKKTNRGNNWSPSGVEKLYSLMTA